VRGARLDRVDDEVGDHLLDPPGVNAGHQLRPGDPYIGAGHGAQPPDPLPQQQRHVGGLPVEPELTGPVASEHEQSVGEAAQPVGLGQRPAQCVVRTLVAGEAQLQLGPQHGHRRA
jgi:hypothetical protein